MSIPSAVFETEDGIATKRERDDRPQSGVEDRGGKLDAEGEKIRGVEKSGSVERDPPIGKTASKLVLSFAETAL